MRTIKFDGKDSWDYYELLTLSIATTEPEPKISKIDIAGRDGDLDVSEAVAGHIVYSNRELEFGFRAIGDDERDCQRIRENFAKDVHGKRKTVEVEDEDHLYIGRCRIELGDNEGYYLDFTVTVDAEPFKRDTEPVIVQQRIVHRGDVTIVNLGDKYVTPTITTDSAVTIECNGVTASYPAGSNIAHFSLPRGKHKIHVEGTTNITVEFWEGYFV